MYRLLELNYSKEDNNIEDAVQNINAIINNEQSQKEVL